jgi:hypothetical protein
VDGNVYVRGASAGPLVAWSPVAGEKCLVELASLDELRKLQPTFERRGAYLAGPGTAIFRSPELRRFDLAQPLPGAPTVADVPAEVRRLLGWPEKGPLTPGAYQTKR